MIYLQTPATLVDNDTHVQCEICGRVYEYSSWDASKITRDGYGYTCTHTEEGSK